VAAAAPIKLQVKNVKNVLRFCNFFVIFLYFFLVPSPLNRQTSPLNRQTSGLPTIAKGN
jgi:hypothetical protein